MHVNIWVVERKTGYWSQFDGPLDEVAARMECLTQLPRQLCAILPVGVDPNRKRIKDIAMFWGAQAPFAHIGLWKNADAWRKDNEDEL